MLGVRLKAHLPEVLDDLLDEIGVFGLGGNVQDKVEHHLVGLHHLK